MIFTSRQARAIAGGRLTQARIPVFAGRACPMKVGHDYPVQVRRGRKLDSLLRIKILARGKQRAGDITLAEARAEGQRTTADWKRAWVRRHDTQWTARDELFDDGNDIVNDILLARFEERHADTLVWAIAFEPLVDAPRFMARPTRTSGDYVAVTARAIDPVECVDEVTQAHYAKLKREDGERRRASFRRDQEEARGECKSGKLTNRALRHINNARERLAR